MGGKSVTLKSVGLAVAMAQLGLLVPAREFEFSLRAFIYYSLQGEDADRGLSTFGAEIQALAAWLPHKNRHGLYLLDEPARGTNPWEGSALVRAILHWLAGGNSLTLAATHFPGVAGMPGVTHLQVAGLSAADLQTVLARGAGGTEALRNLMDCLVPGTGAVPRDALKIAALGLEPGCWPWRKKNWTQALEGVERMKLNLDSGLVENRRAAAQKIAADVQDFIRDKTTVAVERAILRLLGINTRRDVPPGQHRSGRHRRPGRTESRRGVLGGQRLQTIGLVPAAVAQQVAAGELICSPWPRFAREELHPYLLFGPVCKGLPTGAERKKCWPDCPWGRRPGFTSL